MEFALLQSMANASCSFTVSHREEAGSVVFTPSHQVSYMLIDFYKRNKIYKQKQSEKTKPTHTDTRAFVPACLC